MAQPISGFVGPQNAGRGATQTPIRQESTGGMIASKFLPDYTQAMIDGISYSAANQAAQAVSAALATTYTGLLLYNPPNSGVILVPKTVKLALSVAPAAIATIGLIGGYSATGGVTTQTTLLTSQSTQIGNVSKGKGIALSAATIVTPTWIKHMYDGFTAAALPGPLNGPVDLKGKFGILPGAFIAIGALTAVTGLSAMVWDELPLSSV